LYDPSGNLKILRVGIRCGTGDFPLGCHWVEGGYVLQAGGGDLGGGDGLREFIRRVATCE
jgi:hypothetical protein